jgi:hypothetical protein
VASIDLTEDESRPRFTSLRELGDVVMYVPRPWLALVLFAAAVSAIRLNFGGGHAVSGAVSVTALTAVLIALIWLPALLRVLAIAGGGIKTPAGEATTPGLGSLFNAIDPATKRETFPSVLAALTSPGLLTNPREHDESRVLRREIGTQLAAVKSVHGDPLQELERYARDYESLRDSKPPGDERTRQMARLTAEVRAIAIALPLSSGDLERLLEEGTDGDRIVALAAAQDQPDPSLFDAICLAILESHSAFEQFHALVAMVEMVPLLDLGQQRRLAGVLKSLHDDSVRAVDHDSSRASLVRTLEKWLSVAV